MITTSDEYKLAIDAPSRQSKALFILDLQRQGASGAVAASSSAVGYDPNVLLLGRMSFDTDEYVGEHLPEELRGNYLGWQSGIVSGPNGVLPSPEVIVFTYEEEHISENYWIVGTPDEFPTEFTLRVYDANDVLTYQRSVVNNTQYIWNASLEPVKCKKVEFSIRRVNLPERPVILMTGGMVTQLVLNDTQISDFELLEELTSDESLPYGGVSSNTLSFSIHNPNYMFTPSNRRSPFDGLLRPDIPVTGFYGLEIAPEQFEFLPLGKYKVSEWRAPSQALEASITAYDKLFDLQDEPIPMLRVIENATVGDIFNELFIGMGLTPEEFSIDSAVDTTVPYGYVLGSSFGEALYKLSQVGICQVSIDRNNVLVVRSSAPRRQSTVYWTDDNQILSIDNPEKFNALFRNVVVVVHLPSLRRTLELASTTPLVVDSGETRIENIGFSQTPVLQLEQMALEGALLSNIAQVNYGSHDATVIINNPGVPENVSLRAEGVYVKYVKSEINQDIPRATNKRVLRIENELIQTAAQARAVLNRVVPVVSDPFNYFEMDVRGNPALEVGDVVLINAPSVNVQSQYVEIYRQTITYDGALTATAVARIVT